MMPELRPWTRQEMMKRVAFFKDLKGSKGGLPDSDLPECERELINVIGFQPPKEESAAVSPVGAESSRNSAIPISEGFNLGFARAKPGCGPLTHNHNTNETFMPITGRWRVACGRTRRRADCDKGAARAAAPQPPIAAQLRCGEYRAGRSRARLRDRRLEAGGNRLYHGCAL